MSTLRRLLRELEPATVADRGRRLIERQLRRWRKTDQQVATLEPDGTPRGRVLYSYVVDPFCLPVGRPLPTTHTQYWESWRMAMGFVRLGFAVDVIHWKNATFEPRHEYQVLMDVRLNMERLAPLVGDGCLKILHAETAHHSTHNKAQLRRLEELRLRRGIVIKPNKLIEPNRALEHADRLTILGNAFTMNSYRQAGLPIDRIPISVPAVYPAPTDKDIEACRKRFIWFGSGGLVHKGLDLVLDAFAGLSDHELVVCGPVNREREFERAYWRELYELPNIRTVGWVDVAGSSFEAIMRSSLGVVYPSCSEGGGGSAITCMHGGLLPLLTPETSVDVDPAYGRLLEDASVEGIRQAVLELTALPSDELRRMSLTAWEYGRAHHTRERFTEEYLTLLERLLGRSGGGP